MNRDLKSVELKHDGMKGQLVVAGHDLTNSVHAVRMEVGGGLPSLVVQLNPRHKLDVSVEAEVFSDTPGRDADVILAFLQDVDPQWLEEAMLAAPDMGSGMGEAAVAALIDRARKEHSAA